MVGGDVAAPPLLQNRACEFPGTRLLNTKAVDISTLLVNNIVVVAVKQAQVGVAVIAVIAAPSAGRTTPWLAAVAEKEQHDDV